MTLEVRRIRARYSSATVLHSVDIDVRAGQITALVGANGVGKSTLMRCIAGLHKQFTGSVTLDGRELSGKPAHQIARHGIALVPEGRHLFSEFTVAENLTMGLNGTGCSAAEAQARIDEAYELFPILREFTSRVAGALSGGQQQMLAIARSLVRRPQVLLLDEPSLGLAPLLVQQILAVVRQLADSGVAVLLAEQNATAALRVADLGAVMENGALVRVDSAARLLADEDISRHYLGGAALSGDQERDVRALPELLRSPTL